MRHFMLTSWALVALVAMPMASRALDVPMGGETLFEQVGGANAVATARFRGLVNGNLVFERETLLAGSLAATINAANDDYLSARGLQPGTLYLLCLQQGPDGVLRFPSSLHSILDATPTELTAMLDAVRVFLRDRSDRARLEASLLQIAGSTSPFLQVSSVTTLANQQLMTRTGVGRLMNLVTNGRLREGRARELVMLHAGWLKAVELRSAIEGRLLDPAELQPVREAALIALDRIDPSFVAAVMPRLAPDFQDKALGLQQRSISR